MTNVPRGMMLRNQRNQFVKSNVPFHHHGGPGGQRVESRPLLNQQNINMSPRNPMPHFNPTLPPPGFKISSFSPHTSQDMSTSHNFHGPPRGIHMPPPAFPPTHGHGTVDRQAAGYQKVSNNPPLATPFQHGNSGPYPFLSPPVQVSTPSMFGPPSHTTSQEESDRLWVKQWLEQRQIKPSVDVPKKTIKIGEARKLFHQWSNLNEQLKSSRDELIQHLDLPNNEWNDSLARTNEIKNEILSIQEILSDPIIINKLQEKICERKKKRLWSTNRNKRRYLEKLEDERRRERIHKEIDKCQKEKIEKDLAARKEASLKHEAGGVLGEVRRKQHDGRKMLELLKSIMKLREIRKAEGEKKGVYPKTSSEDDRKFAAKSEYIQMLISKRTGSYEEEEKALRVMMVEEEEEREKQQEQERLEQKALLNLSKESDPLADFHRYYGQAEERIEYLIQIRRDWDAYLAPGNAFGASRIPNGEILPSPPSSDLWSAVLVDSNTDAVATSNS